MATRQFLTMRMELKEDWSTRPMLCATRSASRLSMIVKIILLSSITTTICAHLRKWSVCCHENERSNERPDVLHNQTHFIGDDNRPSFNSLQFRPVVRHTRATGARRT